MWGILHSFNILAQWVETFLPFKGFLSASWNNNTFLLLLFFILFDKGSINASGIGTVLKDVNVFGVWKTVSISISSSVTAYLW